MAQFWNMWRRQRIRAIVIDEFKYIISKLRCMVGPSCRCTVSTSVKGTIVIYSFTSSCKCVRAPVSWRCRMLYMYVLINVQYVIIITSGHDNDHLRSNRNGPWRIEWIRITCYTGYPSSISKQWRTYIIEMATVCLWQVKAISSLRWLSMSNMLIKELHSGIGPVCTEK